MKSSALLASPYWGERTPHCSDGHAEAYEQLKKFSRGRQVTAEGLREFISDTALSPTVKEKLKALTPETYVGLASQLAKRS